MKFFYIKHHWLSVKRSPSLDGEVFALFTLTLLFVSFGSLSYDMLDIYPAQVNTFFGLRPDHYHFFLMVYLFMDLSVRMIFKRPTPKLRYYVLLGNPSRQIAWQYLLTSLFGIIPYILFIHVLFVGSKTMAWMDVTAFITVLIWWLSNHYIGLVVQFAKHRAKAILALLIMSVLVVEWSLTHGAIATGFLQWPLALLILLVSATLAYHQVRSRTERREVPEKGATTGLLAAIPVLSFKNPIFQLEWALLVRNKRTRSNLLLGLVSVLVLPFLIQGTDNEMITILIFFFITAFFIVQHGVYSLGWEGSYFDFLITTISPQSFIKTRFLFYIGTCTIGLLLASIPTIIIGLSWLKLFIIFLYNIGVTIPLVLYRSTYNATKIELSENSFLNYNGMMTGPIFLTSFLVVLLPLIIHGIGLVLLGDNAPILLGILGVAGLLLFKPVTDAIARRYHKRKYFLSQSFKR